MSLKGGKGGMVCPVESQRKAWLVALSELRENQRNLMILFKNPELYPKRILLFLAYFIGLSFAFRKLEEREMLEVGFATSLFCFDYLGCWQATAV
jgi:hypothetical protein